MKKIAAAALVAALVRPADAAPASFECRAESSSDLGWNGDYDEIILRESERRGLNPRLVKAIIAVESQFSPSAVSPRGARGLMQLMPATALELDAPVRDLADPSTNIRAGTRYLARLFAAARRRDGVPGRRASEDLVRRVVAAYHAGPAVLEGREWPAPTKDYVRDVLSCSRSEMSVLRLAGYGRFVQVTSLDSPRPFGR
jgi:soluble lytic murein transglycosylase-like protein